MQARSPLPFRRAILPAAVLVAISGLPAVSWGAEATLKDVVISATLSEHDTRTAPASISVVTREELETRNAADLLDAVRGTPGITLSPRQVGGRKTLALRGLEGRHTLTLIDGRRISPSDDVVGHSDYQYGWLPIVAVERIEVIRGPMSTLYGSEALGGVMNVITRQPRERWEGSVLLSGSGLTGGDDDGGAAHHAALFAGGPLGDRLTLRLTGDTSRSSAIPLKEDRRYSEIEGKEAHTASIGGTLKLTAGQSLDASWNDGREERFYDDVSSAGLAYENRYDIQRTQGHLAWRGEFAGWRGQVRAYRSEIDITNARTNGVAVTRPQNISDEVLDGFAAIKLSGHLLTVGGEMREESLKNSGLKNGQDDALHKAVFVLDEFALGNRLTLTAGVRADDHEYFGAETSPRLYLVWEASPELVVKGGYGHAFKAPTLKQISPSYVGAEGPHTFLGNAAVKPEKSDSLEISADWKRGPLSLRGTAFHTELENLITYRLLSVVGPRRTYLYDNVNEARVSGLETGFTLEVAPGIGWNTDLTLLDTQDKATGKDLSNRPETSVSSRLDWQAGDGWSARAGVEYTGSQLDSSGVILPAYALWNASVGKRIGKKISVRAGINNLTDVRLAEENPTFGHAERGRTFFTTLRADF